MSQTLPTPFLSHAAPDLVPKNTSARAFVRSFGEAFVCQKIKPKAIVIATAHFGSATPKLTADPHPDMIDEFAGFGPRLYTLRYPAPGAPEIVRRAAELLTRAGMSADRILGRSCDHGTWVPLMLLFPAADVAGVQLSVRPQAGAAHQLGLGAAVSPLLDEGVLIVGSGSMTHNLQAFFKGAYQPMRRRRILCGDSVIGRMKKLRRVRPMTWSLIVSLPLCRGEPPDRRAFPALPVRWAPPDRAPRAIASIAVSCLGCS
jgi:aromatic ring-opening dioxygenase catalytic subunit (LigB family)